MKKTKSHNKKVKILQGKIKKGVRASRINTFTDAVAGVVYYKSKSLNRQKPKKRK
jgi:hypothetical protein